MWRDYGQYNGTTVFLESVVNAALFNVHLSLFPVVLIACGGCIETRFNLVWEVQSFVSEGILCKIYSLCQIVDRAIRNDKP